MSPAPGLAGGVAARLARRPRLTAFALGAATTPTFAPFHLWYLAPLLLAGLFWLWQRLPPQGAARAGFAYGAGLFLTGTYWLYISVHVFGRAPLWLAIVLMLGLVLIMALYYGLTGWLVARLAGRNRAQFVAVAAAAWVAAEWLRGWVLSGFPWLSLGYAQLDSPLAGYMPVLGVYGVSFAVAVLAALLVVALQAPARVAAAALAAAALVVAAGWALARVDYTEPAGDWLEVALVQGSIDQDRKWLREERLPTLGLYRDLTLARRGVDVFVWPEVALPALRRSVQPYLDALSRRLARDDATLALGILIRDDTTGSIHNSLLAIGRENSVYHKRHLVPFGEYFPVPAFVRDWMRLRNLPHSDMTPGRADQPLLTVAGHPVSATICYEDAFGAEQLAAFPAARFIVNVSNDAWFGDSIAPHHHLDIARARSLEAGRWQLRATNTGVTAIIRPDGHVDRQLPQFETAVLEGRIEPRGGATPYLALGNGPLVTLCLALLALAEWRRRRMGSPGTLV